MKFFSREVSHPVERGVPAPLIAIVVTVVAFVMAGWVALPFVYIDMIESRAHAKQKLEDAHHLVEVLQKQTCDGYAIVSGSASMYYGGGNITLGGDVREATTPPEGP